jgi:ATP/maltotriose-dependent transcriptional regulator MalT
MEDWNLDVPGVIPWRLDASGAHLQLGQLDAAKTHIDAQLTQPGASAARTRGRSLRLLAATGHLQHRTSLLRDAVEMLHASGDQLELGYALADLSGAYHALGDSHRARLTVRRAWRLARECRFDALARVLPDLREAARTDDPDQATAFDALSDAERRVAALAAQGRTNRQIASRLFVTESTVEQHLTRVYRKLQVKRRADLPSSLPADFSNIA